VRRTVADAALMTLCAPGYEGSDGVVASGVQLASPAARIADTGRQTR
jgi:hypothetical protein